MGRIEKPPLIDYKNADYAKLLDELVKLGKLDEFLQINDTSYPYWEKWKYLAKDWCYDAKKLWATAKRLRGPQRNINFLALDLTIARDIPSKMQEQLHELDMNLGGSLHTSSLIPAEEKQRYLISSLMEEAIASSQMEGAATTRKIAKDMLETGRKPRNISEQMIVNNYKAMQWIVKHKNVALTPDRILELHYIITKDSLNDRHEEGTFRRTDDIHIIDVQTGTKVYTPPSHTELKKLIDAFCLFANDENRETFFLHPIAKSIIIHFLIGYIHPFADGNGRTARALFYWYLIKKGYWLIEYMSVSRIILASKAQYSRVYQYTELDDNDVTYFILYNLKAIITSLQDLKKYIARKNREKQQMLSLLRNTEYNERQLAIIHDIINESTIFTVQAIETKFGISNQTARNDLNKLVEKGILQTRKSGNKIQFIPVKNARKKIIL